MAKSNIVPSSVLDDLRDAYLDMRDAKRLVSREVREEFKPRIAEEIERRTRVIERAFAVQFEEVRQRGATRKELVEVLGDGSADVFRKYVELGGGTIAGRKTGADRLAERAENIGVEQIGENLFEWVVDDELTEIVRIDRVEGKKPYVWPVSDVKAPLEEALRKHGKTGSYLYEKAAEIISAFGLEGSQ